MGHLLDKIAVVTGGASGIGRALAEELARRGSKVVVADINGDKAEEVAHFIRVREGGRASGVMIDVRNFDQVKKLVEKTVTRYGALHYLFNNAGIAIAGEARDITIEEWRSVLDVDLSGVVNGAVAAYPVMVDQGFGHIVNVASLAGLVPVPTLASYVASKHGVVGLSNTLRLEGADLGVKVSVVCPGLVRTPIIHSSRMVGIDREKAIKSVPLHLSISPEQCARRILRGVKRNKAVIVVTAWAKVMWWFYRISPGLFMWLGTKDFRKARESVRLPG